MSDQFVIDWIDHGREPECDPNPKFPNGQDVDAHPGVPAFAKCIATLPYPAPRCGAYTVQCRRCGYKVACTTAGRPDDPLSITLLCKTRERTIPQGSMAVGHADLH
jgi:hypothetical protein